FDRLTGTTTLVNHVPGFASATGDGGVGSPEMSTERPKYELQPVISADGNFIAFSSHDNNLVPGQIQPILPASDDNVYLYDRQRDQITLVNHVPGSPNVSNDRPARSPVISADGRYVAYQQDSGL